MAGDAAAAKRRLLWQARRGMLELDLLLIPYVDNFYNAMNERELAALTRLLELSDQTLQGLLYGHSNAADPELADVVSRIRHATAS